MKNFWIERGQEVIEREVLLLKQSQDAKMWFDKMLSRIPIIYSDSLPKAPSDFYPVLGHALGVRFTKHGVEGVLKMPRKYHRCKYYLLYNKFEDLDEPFWIVLHKS